MLDKTQATGKFSGATVPTSWRRHAEARACPVPARPAVALQFSYRETAAPVPPVSKEALRCRGRACPVPF